MTFPVYQANNTNNDPSGTSPFTLNLPTGVVAGDIIIVALSRAVHPQTFTWPTGWTELYSAQIGSASAQGATAWKKIAAGDAEIGASTISVSSTVTSSQARRGASYRVTGGQTLEAGVAVSATTQFPDPPGLGPSWGSADTLWIAVTASGASSLSTYPTNYTTGQVTASTTGTCAMASRSLTASSENPGTFGLAAIAVTLSNTLAIKPIASSAYGFNNPMLGM